MNKDIARVIWMLTAAGWRRSDIVSLFDSLRSARGGDLDELISRAQNEMGLFKSSVSWLSSSDMMPVGVSTGKGASEIENKIIRLLRDEAGLSVSDAIDSMSRGLRKIDRSRAALLPGYSKQSLSQWIRRANAAYSPSELLYVATSIRNALMHGTQLDWGLRKNDDP